MQKNPQWMNDWFDSSLNSLKQLTPQFLRPEHIQPLEFVDYAHLDPSDHSLKVAVLKLNGGLGTSMGCDGPKSLIKISSDGRCFLDHIIDSYNRSPNASDLILLNSFNTSIQTKAYLNQRYSSLNWHELYQYSFKKIHSKTFSPFLDNNASSFNPPGHGSVFYDLYHSGLLLQLKNSGVDYIFISNADNLAASLDSKIMAYLDETRCPFLMELTPKTSADVKGGTVINYDGHLRLWEIAQVGDNEIDLFSSQPYFNTNNIWVSVPRLLQVIESNQLELDLIRNHKSNNVGEFIQMEYAMGSAIQSFSDAKGLIVPRSRFFPVKKTSDLLLLVSDVCSWTPSGELVWDNSKKPAVSLGEPFTNVADFFRLFSIIPSIKNARSIHLSGEVLFDQPVVFEKDVSISNSSSDLKSIGSFI